MKPRILVADDDAGVIAAYRCALLDAKSNDWRVQSAVRDLSKELFGGPVRVAEEAPLNWRVDFVRQGQEAFEAVSDAVMQSDPFTVVFLDIRMPPGIDGCETARRIRQIDASVHIVFVSGYTDYTEEELVEAAGPAHAVSFMQKPVWPDQLRSTARALCSKAA